MCAWIELGAAPGAWHSWSQGRRREAIMAEEAKTHTDGGMHLELQMAADGYCFWHSDNAANNLETHLSKERNVGGYCINHSDVKDEEQIAKNHCKKVVEKLSKTEC